MPESRSVSVRGEGRDLDCFLAFPDGEEFPGPHPAVIVIHEIFGPDAHIQDVCRRITGLGYVAAAPDLFTGALHRLLNPANIAFAMKAFAEAPPELRRDPSKLAAFAESQPPGRRPVLEAFGRISSPSPGTSAASRESIRRGSLRSGSALGAPCRLGSPRSTQTSGPR
ncbi:MAG TPA: dienelactone hydrolase family protein [Thermoplasmata archaeon]|nr:dienelactone hydrolase family protein [Thermoplasmata archaeon]